MHAVTVEARPSTANAAARGQTPGARRAHAAHVERWRTLGRVAALVAGVPALGPTHVVVRLERKDRRSWPDVASCYYEAKAVIDGIRDAGAWPDDNPRWVRSLRFEAPELTGRDALTVELWPADEAA